MGALRWFKKKCLNDQKRRFSEYSMVNHLKPSFFYAFRYLRYPRESTVRAPLHTCINNKFLQLPDEGGGKTDEVCFYWKGDYNRNFPVPYFFIDPVTVLPPTYLEPIERGKTLVCNILHSAAAHKGRSLPIGWNS